MSVCNEVFRTANNLAIAAGMQFDSRYQHWVAARGKFEGEQWYAPYYYNEMCEGNGETIYPDDAEGFNDDPCADLFHVDAEESDAFELDCGSWILLREDSQGFVFVTNHATRKEAEDKFRAWAGC